MKNRDIEKWEKRRAVKKEGIERVEKNEDDYLLEKFENAEGEEKDKLEEEILKKYLDIDIQKSDKYAPIIYFITAVLMGGIFMAGVGPIWILIVGLGFPWITRKIINKYF